MTTENQHYICIDSVGWNTGDSIPEVVNKRIQESGTIYNLDVYRIPLPNTAAYDIDRCLPLVVGATRVIHLENEYSLERGDNVMTQADIDKIRNTDY